MTRPTVAMIVGTGRSGSTLLSFLLNAHPEIISTGEVTGPIADVPDPEAYKCSCGEPLSTCSFWARMTEGMRGRGHPFGPTQWETRFELSLPTRIDKLLTRPLPRPRLTHLRDRTVLAVPAYRRRLERVAARNAAFFETACELGGASVFVDASKDPVRVDYMDRLSELRPLAIHLVRDAPAYVSSLLKRKGRTLASAIDRWLAVARVMAELWPRLPAARRLRLRYEDLCRDTSGEMNRVFGFLGAAAIDGPIHFRGAEHHILGNRMRTQSSDEVRLDDGWRDRLTEAQIDTVLRRTDPYRRTFGYD